MKELRAAAIAFVLAAMLWPEIARYDAERRLAAASAAFELVLDRAGVENAAAVLDGITTAAAATARHLPGDSRGWVLGGSSQLVAGNAERALGFYRDALAAGERAEIHLNLGRAEALLGREDAAEAAFVRAVWISPALLQAVPQGFAARVQGELGRLEAELAAGRLSAPPPPPG